jgi:phage repressor protein C with HTH and peptisase S24 domain
MRSLVNAYCVTQDAKLLWMEKLNTPAERLRWARINKGKYESGTKAAEARGWTVSTYLGHENGDRTPSRKAAERYAAAYGIPWAWIFDGGPLPLKRRDGGPASMPQGTRPSGAVAAKPGGNLRRQSDEEKTVPVRSYVGAGDEVFPIDGDGPIDWVSAPPGMEHGEATEVRGNSMRPLYHDGDLLFHIQRVDIDLGAYKDEVVVAQVTNGKRFVKLLRAGSKRGLYVLESINPAFDLIQDQKLDWIGPIQWVHKRWRQERLRRGRGAGKAG